MQPRTLPLTLIALFMIVSLSACARTQTYDVTVRNDTGEPIIVWLLKDGPPLEKAWISPEELSIEQPAAADEPRNWEPIPPGKTLGTGPISGKFESGVRAWLRIYQGVGTLNEILATNYGSPGRLDIPLQPGQNTFTITREDNKLTAK